MSHLLNGDHMTVLYSKIGLTWIVNARTNNWILQER